MVKDEWQKEVYERGIEFDERGLRVFHTPPIAGTPVEHFRTTNLVSQREGRATVGYRTLQLGVEGKP